MGRTRMTSAALKPKIVTFVEKKTSRGVKTKLLREAPPLARSSSSTSSRSSSRTRSATPSRIFPTVDHIDEQHEPVSKSRVRIILCGPFYGVTNCFRSAQSDAGLAPTEGEIP